MLVPFAIRPPSPRSLVLQTCFAPAVPGRRRDGCEQSPAARATNVLPIQKTSDRHRLFRLPAILARCPPACAPFQSGLGRVPPHPATHLVGRARALSDLPCRCAAAAGPLTASNWPEPSAQEVSPAESAVASRP